MRLTMRLKTFSSYVDHYISYYCCILLYFCLYEKCLRFFIGFAQIYYKHISEQL